MWREEDANVDVKYTDLKSEMDLKSALAKAVCMSMAKQKSGQTDKIFLLNTGNELMWSSIYPNASLWTFS